MKWAVIHKYLTQCWAHSRCLINLSCYYYYDCHYYFLWALEAVTKVFWWILWRIHILTTSFGALVFRFLSNMLLKIDFNLMCSSGLISSFKENILFLFNFREEKGGRKRERNINVWLPLVHPPLGIRPATQACALDQEQVWWPFGLQAGTQPTEPHQPGPE